MCGIVGLYLKNKELQSSLGSMFSPMLVEMTDRGPDSAGIAVYHDEMAADDIKITLFHPEARFDWQQLTNYLSEQLGVVAESDICSSHCVIAFKQCQVTHSSILVLTASYDAQLQVMSYGKSIEIYKETGLPKDIIDRFSVENMTGSHIVGHTRMATESAVTTAGSHPFSTGSDLCLVHNGSLSNHNRLREQLIRRKSIQFYTENDTEVAAAFVSSRLEDGLTLHQVLEDCLETLDGFYTFVAGTRTGFAVLRDPIACKPAVLAETDDYVAFASEYRALTSLPNIDSAKVWEPEPAVVYSWGEEA